MVLKKESHLKISWSELNFKWIFKNYFKKITKIDVTSIFLNLLSVR